MKTKMKKLLTILLSCTILAGSIGVSAFALTGMNDDKTVESEISQSVSSDEQTKISKDETVYVLANADGSVDKIIVSDWIKNATSSDSLIDKSELSDIENVKGDESYTLDSDNMKVWDAKGSDIYYQGITTKQLPVDLAVTYTLDGKTVSTEEIAGKSGKVTIRFDYTNNEYQMVEIDGKEEKIYVPFAMLTGLILDNDNFTNIEVSNGKLINDGSRTFVAGIAFPSLQENLALDEESFEIPDYIEITADVKDFEISNTVTIATNGLFNKIDTDNLNSLDQLDEQINTIDDAMTQLMDGSSQLYDGLCTLLDSSNELISGVSQLYDGTKQLKDGSAQLVTGASDLQTGATQLADGLATLDKNSDSLVDGTKQVFETLLSTANTQLAQAGLDVKKLTIENYSTVLDEVTKSLDEESVRKLANQTAREKVTQAVNAQKDTIIKEVTKAVREQVNAKVTQTVKASVTEKVLQTLGMTSESYQQGISAGVISQDVQTQVENAVLNQMQTNEVKALITQNTDAQMKTEKITKTISQKTDEQIKLLIEQNMSSSDVKTQIEDAVKTAKDGVSSIKALKTQLDSFNEYYQGVIAYTDGVSSAKDGADQLENGTAQLKNGATSLNSGVLELFDGVKTLNDSMPTLKDGVTQLKDGSLTLSDGLKQFYDEGISKLLEAYNGDVKTLLTRAKATVDVSKDYKAFSGISDDWDGNVKFIYRTDAIKVD